MLKSTSPKRRFCFLTAQGSRLRSPPATGTCSGLEPRRSPGPLPGAGERQRPDPGPPELPGSPHVPPTATGGGEAAGLRAAPRGRPGGTCRRL